MKWYGVHTYSGFENKVKLNLEERITDAGRRRLFRRNPDPVRNRGRVEKGERRTSSRKFFPGYILVQMELNDETWHVVKETPKVTGFVGGGTTPSGHSR